MGVGAYQDDNAVKLFLSVNKWRIFAIEKK